MILSLRSVAFTLNTPSIILGAWSPSSGGGDGPAVATSECWDTKLLVVSPSVWMVFTCSTSHFGQRTSIKQL